MDLLEKLFDLYIGFLIGCFWIGGGLAFVTGIYLPIYLIVSRIEKLYKAYRRL